MVKERISASYSPGRLLWSWSAWTSACFRAMISSQKEAITDQHLFLPTMERTTLNRERCPPRMATAYQDLETGSGGAWAERHSWQAGVASLLAIWCIYLLKQSCSISTCVSLKIRTQVRSWKFEKLNLKYYYNLFYRKTHDNISYLYFYLFVVCRLLCCLIKSFLDKS